jgi:hypothetical protein
MQLVVVAWLVKLKEHGANKKEKLRSKIKYDAENPVK